MPHVYLAPYKWTETRSDAVWMPWFPQQCLGSIDLRPISAQGQAGGAPEGMGIFTYTQDVDIPDAIAFGQDLVRELTEKEKDTWRGILNIQETLDGRTLKDVIWNILTIHADATGRDRSKPLMPTVRGNLEMRMGGFSLVKSEPFDIHTHPAKSVVLGVLREDYRRICAEHRKIFRRGDPRQEHYKKVLGAWMRKYRVSDHRIFLPSELPDEGWLPPTTIIGDTFVEASDTDISSHTATGPNGGFSWTELTGDTDIIASTDLAQHQSGLTASELRADSDLSTDDHYSQGDVTPSTSVSSAAGTIGRKDSTTTLTFYIAEVSPPENDDLYKLEKSIDGTRTGIGDAAYDGSDGDTLRLEMSGSSITILNNGVIKVGPITDTSITGNLRAGMRLRGSSEELDNFEAADLAAVARRRVGVAGSGRAMMM